MSNSTFANQDTLPGGDPVGSAARAMFDGFHLEYRLGEGGMGEVWLAEQLRPVRRQVALKVIKAGMDSKEVVARFESERQALALMDHPAIAKVFDGGSTPEGRPYFVMEYVAGIPITEHCDTHKLSTSARLELFMDVCEGVQHAHQKAVIHRDLKPSNILVSLVDGKPQAKIIDFGIAKATGYRLTEKTLFTEVGAVIGTPEYMSPEQADHTGQDVDTRTDVYSLGVLLYQLLTGELPFGSKELRSPGYEELRRKLKEVEPPRPSTKMSTLGAEATEAARNRGTDPGALVGQLEGDLDAITMKALEKERARRYGTPSDLAADIGRHLRHEVVLARPPSAAYRLGKYIVRHRVGVAVAAGLAALLVAFAATMAFQARRTALERDRANAERDRATREREASEKVSAFLANMLSSLTPEALGNTLWKDLHQRVAAQRRGQGAPEKQVTDALASLDKVLAGVNPTETAVHLLDEEILQRAGKTLQAEMGSEPRIAGSLERTLARAYANLGLYTQAEQHARRAVDLRLQALGPEHPDTLRSMNNLAGVYRLQGRLADAETAFRKTLDIERRVLGPNDPETLRCMSNLALVSYDQGHYSEAEKLYRETLEAQRRVLGPEHADTLESMNMLAALYGDQGRYAEAEKLQRETLEVRRRVLGPDDPETLSSMSNLALVCASQGRHGEAEKLYREAVDAERRVLGPEHPDTLRSQGDLAEVYAREGRLGEAETLLGETLKTQEKVLGPVHPDVLLSMGNLASLYADTGRPVEAERLAREAVAAFQRQQLQDSREMGVARLALGRALLLQHRYAESEAELLAAEKLLERPAGVAEARCQQALVTLYAAWETSEPSKGHAAQAARWKAK